MLTPKIQTQELPSPQLLQEQPLLQLERQQVLLQQLQDLQVDRCRRLQQLLGLLVLLQLGQQLDRRLPLRLQVPLLLVSSFLRQELLLLLALQELLQVLQLKLVRVLDV